MGTFQGFTGLQVERRHNTRPYPPLPLVHLHYVLLLLSLLLLDVGIGFASFGTSPNVGYVLGSAGHRKAPGIASRGILAIPLCLMLRGVTSLGLVLPQ